jgi:diadenosine tetraphosphate (Ap4A) HIT family hydrolase
LSQGSEKTDSTCPLCRRLADGEALEQNDLAAALADGYPLNPGHTLIVPTRHQADYFALSPAEQAALWELAAAVRERLDRDVHPDGYNLGLNVGRDAGQTVFHVHLHLIPRFHGDVPDPRGGVRWIIPERARYWDR